MAIDTRAKRMSAMNPGCPWRGPCVDPAGTSSVGKRRAGLFHYAGLGRAIRAGILAAARVVIPGLVNARVSTPGLSAARVAHPGLTAARVET